MSSFTTNRVDEIYLQRVIDDLQSYYTNLFNSLKNNATEKERAKLADKKVDKHTKLLADLMTKSLALKTLLSTIKKKWFKNIRIYNIMLRGRAKTELANASPLRNDEGIYNETNIGMVWIIFLLSFYFLNIYLLVKKKYKEI